MVNIKTIKVGLGLKDLDNLIKKMETLKSGLEEANNKIVKEMAKKVEDEVSKNIEKTGTRDGNKDAKAYSDIKDNKADAGMSGSQVAYMEFGTGTIGESSPHPKKGDFGLRGYNTGKTIRKSKRNGISASGNEIPVGGLYWTYKENGEIKYTQGIPAGLQVYNASNELRKDKIKIIKEEVGEVISKL